ncbi:DUF3833 domain-containing protein [Thalassospira sp.]|uniref:DUF3833 domain-containing protein n=1 Tax=Thalassospira sp. TaxID=1912094 RepID=UPI0027333FFE|nr:DUF3833 domain-containing protein [Thalassospira sp.]MDP2699462.1 DUF3833 domain-containing protein [Thalassospira sp.]
MKPQDFAQKHPKLDVFDYFAGETRAWGIFEDRFGTLRRQFTVDITGTIEDGVLTLEEDFVYDDGEEERRVWKIRKTGDHWYEGEAGDVVGIARGEQYGNALNWTYDMDLKVGDGTWRVSFDDWMFLQADGVMVNRARVRKWGVEIGEVTLFFAKTPTVAQAAE